MIQEMIAAEISIENIIKKFENSWNRHDAKSFASLFSMDADFTNVFGQKAHGRQAIENIHTTIFTTMFYESTLTIEDVNIRFMGEDFAAVDVYWEMAGARDRNGNPWSNRKGLMNLIVKNDLKKWSILIMHNMDLPIMTAVN